jgi:hypothetical protein
MEVAHILDHYVIGRMVIVSTALELVAFAWIYGELINMNVSLGQHLIPFIQLCSLMVKPVMISLLHFTCLTGISIL